jgi:hypothetical protein
MTAPEPTSYPDNAILTEAEVAAWLRLSEEAVRLLDLPCIEVGRERKRRRYVVKHVLDYIERGY